MTVTKAPYHVPRLDDAERSYLLGFGHGLSQIFFQANIWTAALFLAAFVVGDWRMALLVLVGTLGSTLGGGLLRVHLQDLRAGLHGFCGALVGAATFAALGGQWAAYPVALLGGLLCAPVTLAIGWLFATQALARFALPVTTAPFCIVAGVMHATTSSLQPAAATSATVSSTSEAFFTSLLTNVSQVVLVDSVWAGALILLGLLVASWKVGLAAAVGSVVGSLGALATGQDLTSISNGLEGYSGVLTALALSVVFVKSSGWSWALGAVGAALTLGVTILMHHLPGPVYTWPYILTTWVLLVVVHVLPKVERT